MDPKYTSLVLEDAFFFFLSFFDNFHVTYITCLDAKKKKKKKTLEFCVSWDLPFYNRYANEVLNKCLQWRQTSIAGSPQKKKKKKKKPFYMNSISQIESPPLSIINKCPLRPSGMSNGISISNFSLNICILGHLQKTASLPCSKNGVLWPKSMNRSIFQA